MTFDVINFTDNHILAKVVEDDVISSTVFH